MATVRFSDELRSRILIGAKNLFDEQIEEATHNYPKDRWGVEVYDLMFGATIISQMNALPDGYLETRKDMSIAGFKGPGWDQTNDVSITLRFSSPKRVPESFREVNGLGLAEASSYGGHRLDADDPRWDTVKAEYTTYITALAKVEEERRVFAQGVRDVINAYSTLAPALKAWPALWDLIPEQYKDRHKEIVERKKADPKIEGDVDLNRLTAAVTLSKLTR